MMREKMCKLFSMCIRICVVFLQRVKHEAFRNLFKVITRTPERRQNPHYWSRICFCPWGGALKVKGKWESFLPNFRLKECFDSQVNAAYGGKTQYDVKWWSENFGADMPRNWPKFEVTLELISIGFVSIVILSEIFQFLVPWYWLLHIENCIIFRN